MPNPSVGDVRILQGKAIAPVLLPLIPPMRRRLQPPMMGLFGETPIVQRKFGGNSLWEGTPLATAPGIGDVQVVDVEDLFSNWDNVGFEWNFKDNRLEAYLTRMGRTYRVLVPASKIKTIFENTSKALGLRKGCLCQTKNRLDYILSDTRKWLDALPEAESLGAPFDPAVFRATARGAAEALKNKLAAMTPAQKAAYNKRQEEKAWAKKCQGFNLECFVRDVGKEIDTAVNNLGSGISSFFNDPGAWIQAAGRDVGKFIDEVGMVALDVVSHPIFTGIAGALSFVPPLNAVGGAALAASAAANAVKPALSVVGTVAKAVGGDVSAIANVPGVPNLVKNIVPGAVVNTAKELENVVGKAASTVENFKAGTVALPGAARGLMVSALQSQPAPATPVRIAAQSTPRGVQASVYAPSPSGGSVFDAVRGLPAKAVSLWNKALSSLTPTERKLFGYALREPLNGRSVWEALYKSDGRSDLQLGVKAIKTLKGTAGQQLASYLMKARA